MRITATEEYGLRCMILLAKRGARRPLTLAGIGDGEGLSQPYAAKLMNLLRQAGLVDSLRGRHGGYVLAKAPERIRLTDVFDALGEPLFGPGHCERFGRPGSDDSCIHLDDCSVRDVWAGMHRLISHLFDQITLADLVRESKRGRLNLIALAREQLAGLAPAPAEPISS